MNWTCTTCTYGNPNARTMCEMCGSNRPSSAAVAPPPTIIPVGVGDSGGGWICTRCSFNNTSGSSCAMCSSAKPSPAPVLPAQQRAPTGPSQGDIDFFLSMGFNEAQTTEALGATKNNRDRALEWLIAKADREHEAQRQQQSKPQTKPVPPQSSPPPSTATSPGRPRVSKKKKTSRKKGSKKNGKSSSAATAAKEAKEALERAKVREQLEKEEHKRVEAFKKMKLEEAKDAATNAVKIKEQEHSNQVLASLQKDRAMEEAVRSEEKERKMKRQAAEAEIIGIENALARVKENYGIGRYKLMCTTIAKILTKIKNNPAEAKFRSLDLSSEKLQKAVIRPLGGMVIMRELGFKEKDGKLDGSSANLSLIDSQLTNFVTESKSLETCVPREFQHLDATDEAIYFAALEIRRLLSNVLAAHGDLDFMTVDMKSCAYRRRLTPIPQMLKILDEFGFKRLNETSEFMRVLEPSLPLFEAGVIDINKQLTLLGPKTPIYRACLGLARDNGFKIANDVVDRLQKVVARVLAESHDDKFRRININAFFKKYGGQENVKGGIEFFRLFAFKIDEDEEVLGLSSRLDLELLKLRLEDCKRGWEEVMRRRAEAKGRRQQRMPHSRLSPRTS